MRRTFTLRWRGLTIDLDLDPKPLQTTVLLKLSGETYSATSLGNLL